MRSVELSVRHFEGGLPSDPSGQGHCNHGFGLGRYGRSASRTRTSAFWTSWADSLAMIHARHREVASQFVYALENDLGGPCLSVAAQARRTLTAVMGFEPPSWQAVAEGVRPETRPPDEFEPGGVRPSWQHEAASRTEEHFREVLFDTISDRDRALIRSQAGPGAGVAPRMAPITSIQPHLFRPPTPPIVPVSVRSCRCGRLWYFWSSPCSLRSGWCSGAQGVCIGERCCKDLQGGWRSGRHQHFHAGLCGACHGQQTFFSEGLSSQLTRLSCVQCIATVLHTSEPPSVMELFLRRRASGRNDVAQSWWTSTQSSIGGAHGGSCRWSAETRSFLAHLAQGTVSSRGASFAETRRTSVVHQVGGHSNMRFSQGCRHVSS